MRVQRFTAVALAAAFCAALTAGMGSATERALGPVRLAAATTGDAVTKAGTGAFSSLRVTVQHTKNLVDQVVAVSWSGGTPTQPAESFGTGYLQLMQCWGNAADGPTPAQCEFGGKAVTDSRGGDYTATRQLNYGGLVDTLDNLVPKPAPSTPFLNPFESVTGKTVNGNTNEFFDASTTNEIPFARTRGDGNGQEYFETQTAQEASGLGCGQVVNGKPRGCWLVVVPRNDREVDGSQRDATSVNRLKSSPLSATNWKNRLVFPLGFAPVGNVCPIGAAERRTVGVEPFDEAFVRWQPALCAKGGPVYGFSQVTDSVANRQVLSNPPGMGFVTDGVPASQVTSDRPLTYAPVALTGLTVSYLIESQSGPNAPPEVQARDGERISTLNLTPRLVAKLLTQSYQLAVNSSAGYLKQNPGDLTRDPDFLALNPAFKDLSFSTPLADMLVPESLSNSTSLLWRWIGADADARDFLAGQPDPWGMRINPFYQGTATDRDDFPKVDPYCVTYPVGGPAPLCTLDAHPYAADMHDAARSASRGDPLARSAWDPNALPPSYKKTPPQLNGRRAILALADTATSARFSLSTARLRNAAGQFVAPTDASLALGERSMSKSATPGLLQADPTSRTSGAYPLVSLTYAVTAPTALSAPEAKDYANLIRYAVGAGQTRGNNPGQLPDGYLPLAASLRTQALASAVIVQARKGGTPPAPTPDTSNDNGNGTDVGTNTGNGDLGGTGLAGDGSDAGSAPAADSPSADLPDGVKTPSTVNADGAVKTPTLATQAGAVTPADKVGAARYALPIVLILGGLAAAGGPALPLARRRIAALRR
jgi:hypothetical protein